MYIVIGADLVPTDSNTDLFVSRDATALVGEDLKAVLDNADYRIFNLEVPLTDVAKPITKQGPNLIAPTNTVAGYEALGVDILTLANNHILDQDVSGLECTIKTLDNSGINHVGAGENLTAASKPFSFSFAGKRIAVYACAEHEFSLADEDKPGANPFDPLWSFDHVAEMKKGRDFVIVLYHGGKEHYRYPSPMLQKVCRRFVDKGADLVICQHSHCIGCEEKYRDRTIVYGQGNFIFDDCDDECWQTSLLVKIEESLSISYIALEKKGNGVRLAKGDNANQIMCAFQSRSNDIKDSCFIDEQYSKYAKENRYYYLNAITGKKPLLYWIINKITRGLFTQILLDKTYENKEILRVINYIDCEAHRELLLKALSEQLIR